MSNLNKLIFQTNSFIIMKILTKEWDCPWNVVDYVEQIRKLLHDKQVRFQHILREGIQLADHLANTAIDNGGFSITIFQQLQVKGKKILNGDRLQCPHIRLSLKKG